MMCTEQSPAGNASFFLQPTRIWIYTERLRGWQVFLRRKISIQWNCPHDGASQLASQEGKDPVLPANIDLAVILALQNLQLQVALHIHREAIAKLGIFAGGMPWQI